MENYVTFFCYLSNSRCFEIIDNQVIASLHVFVHLKNALVCSGFTLHKFNET